MIGKHSCLSGRAGWLAVVALVTLLTAGGAGRAAVYVNQDAGPAHDGKTWATAFTTVGAGLGAAASGDEVWVAKGTYQETVSVPAGVSLYGGFAGTETSRNERDWNANPTAFDGAGSYVVTCHTDAVVDGFTILNGGSGVVVNYAAATLSNNIIRGNGNGVAVGDGAAATLSNNTISGNRSNGVVVSHATATLSSNTIFGNGGCGVAVAGRVTLSSNTISGNGNYGVEVGDSGTATLSSNTISANGYDGVNVSTYATATLSNNTISRNRSNGVWVVYSARATVSNNTISGNSYDGVHVSGTATVSNNTIYGNRYYGVDVYHRATLSNNTISGNGSDGVEVYSGMATLSNNIVAFNSGYGIEIDYGSILTFSHNDVFGNTRGGYCVYTPPSGKGNISLDPLFVSWVNRDLHLQSRSPCIDAGEDSVVTPGSTDKDGKCRIIGSHVDIGAYEYGTAPAPFTMADVGKALCIASGLLPCTAGDLARLHVAPGSAGLDVRDAVCVARKARKGAGLARNP